MNEKSSVPEQEIIEDLREKLISEFQDCGENCTRAYYGHERDSDDHDASNALRILEPLIGQDFRDDLRIAYKADRENLSLYDLRQGEKTLQDRYAQVALRIAKPALQELIADGMGLKE